MRLIIEDLEPLGGLDGGDAGDDVDFTEAADFAAVTGDDTAATEEVFVGLWLVEATY